MDATQTYSKQFLGKIPEKARALAVGPDGTIYVCGSTGIWYRPRGGTGESSFQLLAGGSRGHADGGFKVAQFDQPCCITIMSKDHAVVVGEDEGRSLRLLDLQTQTVSTLWSSTALGDHVLGVAESPFHPNVVYFLTKRHVLMSLNRDTGARQVVAGKSEFSLLNPSPVDGPFSKCRLHFPRSLAADTGHRLYFVEWFERRIRYFDLQSQSVETYRKFSLARGGTSGVAVDQRGRLFVTCWNSGAFYIVEDSQPKPKITPLSESFKDAVMGVDVDALGNGYTCDAAGEIHLFSPVSRDQLVPGTNALRLIPELTRAGFVPPDPTTQPVMASFSAAVIPEAKTPPPQAAPKPSAKKLASAPKVPPKPKSPTPTPAYASPGPPGAGAGGYLVMIESQGRSQRVGPFTADSLDSFIQTIYEKCTLLTPPYEIDIWDQVFSAYVKLDDFSLLPENSGAVKLSLVKTATATATPTSPLMSANALPSVVSGNLRIDSRWIISPSDLEFTGVLGSGAFGMVHKAKWRGTPVAVKETLTSGLSPEALYQFQQEVELLLGMQPHPNVVAALGCAVNGDRVFLVMEWCAFGSLDHYLRSVSRTMTEKMRILLDAARGLAHLHALGVIHRDIAARNVLVAQGGTAKITDFGMSRKIDQYGAEGATTSSFGPIRWMAPESLRSRTYSTKSDVWMFAALAHEILVECPPYPEMPGDRLFDIATGVRDGTLRPSLPPSTCPPNLADLLSKCWSYQPENRPSMSQVVPALEAMIGMT